MGNIISNILITIIGDWHILLSVIGAGYWFSRQTKKALQKELQKEIKDIRETEIKDIRETLNDIKDRVAKIEVEIRLEKRMSKMEEKLEG